MTCDKNLEMFKDLIIYALSGREFTDGANAPHQFVTKLAADADRAADGELTHKGDAALREAVERAYRAGCQFGVRFARTAVEDAHAKYNEED